MHRLLVVLGFAGAAFLASQAATQATAGETPEKAGVARTVKLTATITAIDKTSRDITLKGSQGNEVTVTAGPDVKNFDNMRIGDQVNVEYVEALTLELRKGGGKSVGRTEQAGAVGAKPGERPAGAAGRQVTIVADVVNVDSAKQTVTLRGPNRTIELAVPDAEQLKRVTKGDQVDATYTEAFAIRVEPAAKK
jgi:hypothetical protein